MNYIGVMSEIVRRFANLCLRIDNHIKPNNSFITIVIMASKRAFKRGKSTSTNNGLSSQQLQQTNMQTIALFLLGENGDLANMKYSQNMQPVLDIIACLFMHSPEDDLKDSKRAETRLKIVDLLYTVYVRQPGHQNDFIATYLLDIVVPHMHTWMHRIHIQLLQNQHDLWPEEKHARQQSCYRLRHNPFEHDTMLQQSLLAKFTTSSILSSTACMSVMFLFTVWPIVSLLRKTYPLPADMWDDDKMTPECKFFYVSVYYPLVCHAFSNIIRDSDERYAAYVAQHQNTIVYDHLCYQHLDFFGEYHPMAHLQAYILPQVHENYHSNYSALLVFTLELLARFVYSPRYNNATTSLELIATHIIAVFRQSMRASLLKYVEEHKDDILTYCPSPANVFFPNLQRTTQNQNVNDDDNTSKPNIKQIGDFFKQTGGQITRHLLTALQTPPGQQTLPALVKTYENYHPSTLRFFMDTWTQHIDIRRSNNKVTDNKQCGSNMLLNLNMMSTLALYAESPGFCRLPLIMEAGGMEGSVYDAVGDMNASKILFLHYFEHMLMDLFHDEYSPCRNVVLAIQYHLSDVKKAAKLHLHYMRKLNMSAPTTTVV